MSFSFDETRLDIPLNALRAEVGDTQEGAGPLPNGDNLSNEQLLLYLEQETSLGVALVRAVGVIQRRWATVAQSLGTKNRTEAYMQAQEFGRIYRDLKTEHGKPTFGGAAGSSRYKSGNVAITVQSTV